MTKCFLINKKYSLFMFTQVKIKSIANSNFGNWTILIPKRKKIKRDLYSNWEWNLKKKIKIFNNNNNNNLYLKIYFYKKYYVLVRIVVIFH
jgi:hypothetical protein